MPSRLARSPFLHHKCFILHVGFLLSVGQPPYVFYHATTHINTRPLLHTCTLYHRTSKRAHISSNRNFALHQMLARLALPVRSPTFALQVDVPRIAGPYTQGENYGFCRGVVIFPTPPPPNATTWGNQTWVQALIPCGGFPLLQNPQVLVALQIVTRISMVEITDSIEVQ